MYVVSIIHIISISGKSSLHSHFLYFHSTLKITEENLTKITYFKLRQSYQLKIQIIFSFQENARNFNFCTYIKTPCQNFQIYLAQNFMPLIRNDTYKKKNTQMILWSGEMREHHLGISTLCLPNIAICNDQHIHGLQPKRPT